MSWHVISDVYKAKLGSPTRKAIAAKLADWADDDGGSIFPSVKRIAEETETSVRTVQYVLREFVAEGLLVVVKEGGHGPGSTTEYRMSINYLSSLPRTKESNEAKGATVAPIRKPLRVQPAAKRVQPTTKKGAPVAPDSSVEPSILERERAREMFCLPMDWRLPDAWRSWALKEAPEHAHLIENDAKKFRAHWRGKARVCSEAEWEGEWQKWWLRTIEKPAAAGASKANWRNVGGGVTIRDTSVPWAVERADYVARGIIKA